MKRVISIFLIAVALVFCVNTESLAKTKLIVVAKMKGNTLTYHKAAFSYEVIPDADFENIIGYGKKKSISIAKNAKFYILKNAGVPEKVKRVSKTVFKNKLYSFASYTDNGVKWYWGTACRMTVKNGKVTKLVQVYQA